MEGQRTGLSLDMCKWSQEDRRHDGKVLACIVCNLRDCASIMLGSVLAAIVVDALQCWILAATV